MKLNPRSHRSEEGDEGGHGGAAIFERAFIRTLECPSTVGTTEALSESYLLLVRMPQRCVLCWRSLEPVTGFLAA